MSNRWETEDKTEKGEEKYSIFRKIVTYLLIPIVFLGLREIDISNVIGYDYYKVDNSMALLGVLHDYDVVIAAGVVFGLFYLILAPPRLSNWLKTPLLIILSFILVIFTIYSFYYLLFGINYLTAKPESQSVAILKNIRHDVIHKGPDVYHLFVKVRSSHFDKVYDYHTSRDFYERCKANKTVIFTAVIKKGCFGYAFISDLLPLKNLDEVKAKETEIQAFSERHLRVRKNGVWYTLNIDLRYKGLSEEMEQEVSKGLFGYQMNLHEAAEKYIHSFDEVGNGPSSEAYPLIDICMESKYDSTGRYATYSVDKTLSETAGHYEYLYEKRFTYDVENNTIVPEP